MNDPADSGPSEPDEHFLRPSIEVARRSTFAWHPRLAKIAHVSIVRHLKFKFLQRTSSIGLLARLLQVEASC